MLYVSAINLDKLRVIYIAFLKKLYIFYMYGIMEKILRSGLFTIVNGGVLSATFLPPNEKLPQKADSSASSPLARGYDYSSGLHISSFVLIPKISCWCCNLAVWESDSVVVAGRHHVLHCRAYDLFCLGGLLVAGLSVVLTHHLIAQRRPLLQLLLCPVAHV